MTEQFLIVGASSGIGAATAQRLRTEGKQVVALSRTCSENPDLVGVDWRTVDILDRSQPLPDIEGPLSGLLYCPGSINLKPFQSLKEEDFYHDWEVNCFGAVRVLQHYLPRLKEAKDASVVLMSTVAVGTGMPFHASVAAAKGAVEGLTRSLAAEFAPRIRVNALAPSLTDTRLAGALLADEKRRSQAAKRHPMQRVGSAGEMAEVIHFLLSDKAGWITGQVLHVDGGLSSLKLF